MTTMSSLQTALDLLQNDGITSGIDMFLDVFWTLNDGAKVFGANVCGQELQWLFTKYLLHATHLQVNLGRLWCNFVFLDVHDVF